MPDNDHRLTAMRLIIDIDAVGKRIDGMRLARNGSRDLDRRGHPTEYDERVVAVQARDVWLVLFSPGGQSVYECLDEWLKAMQHAESQDLDGGSSSDQIIDQ